MAKSPRNYLSSIFWLVLLIVIILLGLYFIPSKFIEEHNLRPIDILSDIRKDTTLIPEIIDSIPEPPRIDTCRTGLTCFDDFSPAQNGLDHFFKALDSIKTLRRPVRVAFFGDSFIEGDIFCGDLREKLQETYGGHGVGMMPLASQTSGFRQTVIHNFGAWNSYSLLDKDHSKLGISGRVFIPGGNAWAYYGGVSKISSLDTCQRLSIFYTLEGNPVNLSYKFNKKVTEQIELTPSSKVQRLDIDSIYGNVQLSFPSTNQLAVYGVSLEDTCGILVDNYSMRSTSGNTLRYISHDRLTEFNEVLPYDLIILEYGLNVMEAKRTNYKYYEDEMIKTVNYLKSCFPESNILLIGVSDRSMRKDGDYVTMPAVPALIAGQKRICAETGIVFWNLFEAMGGENSMYAFVKASPPKANKDYTHLTFQGGKFLGNILYETIMYEKERYDVKKDYESKIKK